MERVKNFLNKYGVPILIIAIVAVSVYLKLNGNPFTTPEIFSGTTECCETVDYEEGTAAQILAPLSFEAKIGDLIEIDLSEAKAKCFKWIIEPETTNYRIIECGRKLLLSHGQRETFRVFVAGALGDTVDSAIIEIKIRGSAPVNPTPDEEEDDGEDSQPSPLESELARDMLGWLDEIDTENTHGEAIALSQSFMSASAMVSAGVVDNIDKLIEMTRIQNRKALGDQLDGWKPFLNELNDAIGARYEQGDLDNLSDHAKLWKEIGQALAAVAERL